MSYSTEFYSTFENSGQGAVFDKKEFEHNQYFFYSTNGDPTWGLSVNAEPYGSLQSSDPSGGQDISVVLSSCGYPPWSSFSGCTTPQIVGKFHRNYYEFIYPNGDKEWRGNAWVSNGTGFSSGTEANIETISFANTGGEVITSSYPVLRVTQGNISGDQDLTPETPPAIATHNLTVNNASSFVGYTTGNFNVDESGAANYQIPVFALPGIGGLKPEMSLSYNSNSGNGVAGVGWNIGGSSSITRCLQNREQDGIEYTQQKPISLTNEDSFCLDGQKLLLVPGTGNNGVDGAEYRTEIESFQKIKVKGVSGNGPNKFIVNLKNGEIRTYGSNVSLFTAQVLANDGSNTIVQWLLNKVQDRHGNKIWYKWDTSNQGQAYIERIEWTRRSAASNPQNTMDFIYESRADKKHAFAKGISNQTDKRLSHVITNRRLTPASALQQIRSLKLTYETSDLTGRSLLSSVKECSSSAHNQCLKPINFQYSGDGITNLFDTSYSQNGDINDDFWQQSSSKFIDINGDGKQEMLFVKKSSSSAQFYMALHYESSFNLAGMTCTTKAGYYNRFCNLGITATSSSSDTDDFDEDDWYVLDYDADGKQDLLSRKSSTGNWHVFKSNGSRVCKSGARGCSSVLDVNTGIQANPSYISNLVDMTGDGLADLMSSQLVPAGTERKMKLHKMLRDTSTAAANPYYFETSADASFLEVISHDGFNQLIPEMFPDDGSCVIGTLPCYEFLQAVWINRVKTGVTDINGDGFNDAIVTYSMLFDLALCNDGNPDFNSLPTSSTSEVYLENDTEQRAVSDCVQKHVAVFTFNPDHNNGPAYIPYKWIGGVYSPTSGPGNPSNPIVSYKGNILNERGAVSAIDINGDGLSDLVIKKKWPVATVQYRLNTGSDFSSSISMVQNSSTIDMDEVLDGIQFLDYDRDGDTDILYPQKQIGSNTTRYYLKKYSGDLTVGYNAATLTSLDNLVSGMTTGQSISYFMDINGDAHIDHLWFDFNNKDQKIKFGTNKWRPNDKMVKFKSIANNGKFSDTDITYESGYLPTVYSRLNDGIYQKDDFGVTSTWGNGSPVFDVAFPEYYVRKVSALAPIENNSNNRANVYYHYQGLRLQGGGRGMLGFAKVSTVDEQSNMYTVTHYNQDFPYIGMPYSTEKGHLTNLTNSTTSCSVNSSLCTYNICVGENCEDPLIGSNLVDPISDGINQYKIVSPASTSGSVFSYVWKTIDEFYELGSSTSYKMNVTKTSYENTTIAASFYGNVSSTIVKSCIPDANSICYTMTNTKTVNTYAAAEQDVGNWILGRLTKSRVENWRRNEDPSSPTYLGWLTQITTTNFDYDNSNGQILSEEVEGDNQSYLKTIHQYDTYGNETKTIVCSLEITNCTSTSVLVQQANRTKIHSYARKTYDSSWHAFVNNTYSLYGTYINNTSLATEKLDSQVISRDIYGNVLKVNDIYGKQSESKYGQFGELQTSKNATGAMTKTINYWCPAFTCPGQAVMVTVSTAVGLPTKRQYKDVNGRTIRVQTQSMDGFWKTVNSWYDDSGRVARVTQPHLRYENGTLNGTVYNNYTSYDDVGRTISASVASHLGGSATTTYSYNGLTNMVINPKGQKKITINDVSGKVVEVQDFNSNSLYNRVNYYYGGRDNLIKMVSEDDGGNDVITTMTYDNLGRKRTMDDPSKGYWTYTYNAMGKMIKQVDSLGQQMFFNYDMRGRKILAVSTSEFAAQRKLATWKFDQRNFWGQLTYSQENVRAKAGNATLAEKEMFFDFDSFGRSSTIFTQIDDGQTIGLTDSYETATTYDQYGRIFQSFDASGYGLMMQFNAYGYQTKLFEAIPCQDPLASSCATHNAKQYRVYYEAQNMDAYGNITAEKHHNGAIFTKRTYHPQDGFLDKICSSESDSSATSCTSNNILQKLTFGFDAIGNLVNKNDATNTETYNYDHLNRLTKVRKNRSGTQLADENYVYGTSGNLLNKNGQALFYNGIAGPHAVSSHGGTSFSYNSNGDMIESFSGTAPKLINYTSFSKPYYIHNKANNNTSEFFYGTGNSRFVRKDVTAGISTVTHYVGGIEMVRKAQLGSIEHIKRYIGGGLVIDMPGKFVPQSNWSYDYLLKDHIGSTHRIVSIDANNIVNTQRLDFNAWGQRRDDASLTDININNVLFALNQQIAITTHGFTGHEHLDGVGLIHMNGRIYDPTLGRFLQADPHIQDPFNSQSLNRYSYVLNNPLTFTDPSGYFSLSSFFKKWVRPLAAIAVSIWLPGAGFWAAAGINSTTAIAMISGTISGAISSGNLKGALIGGLTAGAFKGVGDKFAKLSVGKVLAHGAVGGASSLLQGGKFGHGFVSAGVTQSFSGRIGNISTNAGRVAAAAILGGTVSKLTGDKFANGAITGAFSRAFNEGLHFRGNEEQEQIDRNKDYLEFEKGLSKSEQNALRAASFKLGADHGMAKFLNSARQNNIIGIGIFTVDKSFEFSAVTENAINGVLDNSPTGGRALEFVCNLSVQIMV